MAAKTARFTVSVDEKTAGCLNMTAKHQHKPISGLIYELITEALEMREDMYWSKVAEEAEKKAEGKPTVPAEVLWKELGIE
jgi:hypothetical protein